MHFDPCFHSEQAAQSFCESVLWPAGPVCPHCRATGERIARLKGKSTRRGTYKCYACRRPFTVRIGTVFESSHLDLHLWLQAIYLISFAGMRAPRYLYRERITVRQLEETLGVARKTAWLVSRRIRELTKQDDAPSATADEHRAAFQGNTVANARTVTADRNHKKPIGGRTGPGSSPTLERPEAEGSKATAQGESGKPRSKRRQRQPDPKQTDLFR